MSFEPYRKLVFDEYLQKCRDNALSSKLILPTLANLRDECVRICTTNYDPKDVKVLTEFFKDFDFKTGDELGKKIDKCDIEMFKALLNYVKGKTRKPDTTLTEMLAWLIDFRPRPFEVGRDYKKEPVIEVKEVVDEEVKKNALSNELEKVTEFFNVEKPESEKGNDTNGEENKREDIFKEVSNKEEMAESNPEEISRRGSKKRIVLIVITSVILLFLLGGSWFIWKITTWNGEGIVIPKSPLPERCMYWTGEEYKEVDCSKKFGSDTVIVAFDSARLVNFKRIMRPDTITFNAIGYVWYCTNGKLGKEYYTADGDHPVNPKLRLRPITEYIIRNHVIPLKGQSQN